MKSKRERTRRKIAPDECPIDNFGSYCAAIKPQLNLVLPAATVRMLSLYLDVSKSKPPFLELSSEAMSPREFARIKWAKRVDKRAMMTDTRAKGFHIVIPADATTAALFTLVKEIFPNNGTFQIRGLVVAAIKVIQRTGEDYVDLYSMKAEKEPPTPKGPKVPGAPSKGMEAKRAGFSFYAAKCAGCGGYAPKGSRINKAGLCKSCREIGK